MTLLSLQAASPLEGQGDEVSSKPALGLLYAIQCWGNQALLFHSWPYSLLIMSGQKGFAC